MNTTAEATTKTTAAPRYELVQTLTWAGGFSKHYRTPFNGSAKQARKERLDRLKAAKRPYRLDGDTVAYDTPGLHGYETRLEWVQL